MKQLRLEYSLGEVLPDAMLIPHCLNGKRFSVVAG